MFSKDGAIGGDHEYRVVQFCRLLVSFWMRQEHGHMQARGQLANISHPWIGLWHDPVGADLIGKGVATDTQLRRKDPCGA
jgi:hypothetical protein